jgi:hypothetical protein
MSHYAFARKFDLSTPTVRGVGASPVTKDVPMSSMLPNGVPPMRGAGGEIVSGAGAMSVESRALVGAAAVYGVMYYGVVLATKGALLAGGAAFIAGPIAASMLLSAVLD